MNAEIKKGMDMALCKYIKAIAACNSFSELVEHTSMAAASIRRWLKKNMDRIPSDCKPQWLIEAMRIKTPQENGKMGGQKGGKAKPKPRLNLQIQNSPKPKHISSGAIHQAKIIESRNEPTKITLAKAPWE
jgi:hypothetical protein